MSNPRARPWLPLALAGVTLLGAALRLVNLSSLPPGEYLDEARVNSIARDVLASGQFRIYFPFGSFGGYHPAAIYLAALGRWLTGGSPYALRDGVAAVNVLSLPLFFLALRAIFQLDQPRPRADWLALAGTLCVALCVSQIINSRNGLEATLPMPWVAITFLFLAQGLRLGRPRDFALAGAALGLALYTHLAALFLPVAVVAAMLWVAVVQGRGAWGARAKELLLLAACSLVVALPLLAFFAVHPETFIARGVETTAFTRDMSVVQLAGVLLASTVRALGALVLPGWGDVLSRHNLPGRPLFDAFMAVCLTLGAALAAATLRQRSRALLASWAVVMMAPAILTVNNDAPQFGRLITAAPALAGLAALGLLRIFDALRPRGRWLAGGLVSVGLAFSLAATGAAVFVRWAAWPDLYDAFLAGDWRAANLALDRSRTQDVYLSPELISDDQHAAFDLLLRGGPVRDFPGPGCLLYRDPAARPQTFIVFNSSDKGSLGRIAALFPQGSEAAPILHQPNPYPDYRIYQAPAGAPATPPQHAAIADFGAALRLAGYDLSAPALHAGDTLTVTLYWQALQPVLPEYLMFVHLYLPGGEVGAVGVSPQPVAQTDGAPCGQTFHTPRWQPGETVVDERVLTVPADYTAGSAALGVGVYAWPSLERLAVSAPAGVLPGDRLSLGTIAVGPRTP